MIDAFESTSRTYPNRAFLTFVDASGAEASYTYRQTRLLAAAIARRLRGKGVRAGDYVSVDLPNCAEYVLLALAAAYGSFTLVCLNNRLTETEKITRLLELEREGMRVAYRIDAPRAQRLLTQAKSTLKGEVKRGTRIIMGAERDAVNDVIHFAEREAHLFNANRRALVMFTSGTTGKAKAVALTWRQLIDSAKASNRVLSVRGEGMWQAALPLYHIGGFQMLVRSVENWTPLRLYERFDARLILEDARKHGATHISVVDKMLRDLLAAEETALRAEPAEPSVAGRGTERGANAGPRENPAGALAAYRCILLGGGPLNASTVARSLEAGVRVYASYGMTETASQVASTLVTPAFTGGLKLLPGYSARIVDPDEQGFGRLAVRGPGVFSGYLNAHAAFTVDGYFLTGDTAALYDGAVYVRERTSDMFVSGGENVYPAEIAAALVQVPGVADAHVFGAPDETWGRRPVAIVERAAEGCAAVAALADVRAGAAAAANVRAAGAVGVANASSASIASDAANAMDTSPSTPPLTPASLREALSPKLSKLYMPKHFCLADELPRSGIGKIDRRAAESLYENRLEIDHVALYHVRLPFKQPFKTARGTLTERDTLIVEVIDRQGRSGLGECVAFTTDWYLPETLGQDARVLRSLLIPLVCDTAFLHPREVSRLFAAYPEAVAHPMACAALEMALWDLYGKIVGKPLWRLMNEEYAQLGGKLLKAQGDFAGQAGGWHKGQPAAGAAAGGFGVASDSARPASASFAAHSARKRVPAGAVVGMGSPAETVAAVRACVNAGYTRVKLKIAPGQGLASVRAVREAFPKLLITLDANQSFPLRALDELREYDNLNISWIEEPVSLAGASAGASAISAGAVSPAASPGASADSSASATPSSSAFLRLASLQRTIQTPVCLDESFANAAGAYRALTFPELRCIAVKLGKFGGIQPAFEFACHAHALGREVWMGGMYDTGISKRAHAAFQTLPGITVPGDVGATSRYFDTDITSPPYEVDRGCVVLNEKGYESGLGCALDRKALAKVLVKRIVLGK